MLTYAFHGTPQALQQHPFFLEALLEFSNLVVEVLDNKAQRKMALRSS